MSDKRQSGLHRPSTPTPLRTRSKTRLRTMPPNEDEPHTHPPGGAEGTSADEIPAPRGRETSPSSEGHSDRQRGADSHPNDTPDNEPANDEVLNSCKKMLAFLQANQRLTFVNHLFSVQKDISRAQFTDLLAIAVALNADDEERDRERQARDEASRSGGRPAGAPGDPDDSPDDNGSTREQSENNSEHSEDNSPSISERGRRRESDRDESETTRRSPPQRSYRWITSSDSSGNDSRYSRYSRRPHRHHRRRYRRSPSPARDVVTGTIMSGLAGAIEKMNQSQTKKRKVDFPPKLKKYSGSDNKREAMTWTNNFNKFLVQNRYTEEELLNSFGEILLPESNASEWYDLTGKECDSLPALMESFKRTFWPNEQYRARLADEIKIKKQEVGQSFFPYSNQLFLLNEELGSPYSCQDLIGFLILNMNPEIRSVIKRQRFLTLADLQSAVQEEEEDEIEKGKRKLDNKGHNVKTIETMEQLHAFKKKLEKDKEKERQPPDRTQPVHTAKIADKTKQQAQRDVQPIVSKQNPIAGDQQVAPKESSRDKPKIFNDNRSKNSGNRSDKSSSGYQSSSKGPRKPPYFKGPGPNNITHPDLRTTKYQGKDEEHESYHPMTSCWICGRKGFTSGNCPYHNLPDAIKAHTERMEIKRQAYKARSGSEVPRPVVQNPDSGNGRWGNN